MSQTKPDPEAPEDSSFEDELIAGHDYDGIREYDNPIPGWLSLLFVGTIVWSVLYVVAIQLGYIDDYEATLEQSQEEIAFKQAKAAGQGPDAEMLQKAVGNAERVSAGEKVFKSTCASCHGKKGGGEIGPNLTDKYWLYGGSLPNIYKTVKEGTQKGMPAWGPQLSDKEMVNVVAYIRSIQGTNPPNAADPQGEKYTP